MKTQPNFGAFHTPFGSVMEGRSFTGDTSAWYRFGFGGQEKDDEIYGKGKTYSAEFWEYDARVGRRWNVDPEEKKYPSFSPYLAFFNSPVLFNDPNGDDPDPKKANRSIKKYERKFKQMNRKMSKGGVSPSSDDVHKGVEDKYNKRRWMWVKDVSTGDPSTTESVHKNYWHAGDLFKQTKSVSSTLSHIVTSSTTLTRNARGAFINPDGFTVTAWDEYTIGSSGVINVNLNTTAPGWNFDIFQSDGSTSPIVLYNDLYGSAPGVSQVANWQSTPSRMNISLPIPIDVRAGTLFYIAMSWNTRGTFSTGGMTPNTSVTTTTSSVATRSRPMFQARAVPVVYDAVKGTKNVHRLSKSTITALNRNRDDFKLRNP